MEYSRKNKQAYSKYLFEYFHIGLRFHKKTFFLEMLQLKKIPPPIFTGNLLQLDRASVDPLPTNIFQIMVKVNREGCSQT